MCFNKLNTGQIILKYCPLNSHSANKAKEAHCNSAIFLFVSVKHPATAASETSAGVSKYL
jgi:hypothetical protein